MLASGLGGATLIKGCNPGGSAPFLPTVPWTLARPQSWSGGSGLKTRFPRGGGWEGGFWGEGLALGASVSNQRSGSGADVFSSLSACCFNWFCNQRGRREC